MTIALHTLIREASTELGSEACRDGKHLWASEGGRACPHEIDAPCSQAVYRCSICGTWDYGEPGGPGDADCERYCRNKPERLAAMRIKPLPPKLIITTTKSLVADGIVALAHKDDKWEPL